MYEMYDPYFNSLKTQNILYKLEKAWEIKEEPNSTYHSSFELLCWKHVFLIKTQ